MTTPEHDVATARARAFAIIRQKSFARRTVILASGKQSDHYFNMKPSMLDPEGANLLAWLVLDRLEGRKADAIGGLEMGAIPLIGPIAALSWQIGRPIPGFFVRKEQKGYGAQNQIEGLEDVRGLSVVIVDDVTTTGGSAMKSLEVLKAAGARIELVIALVDRLDGARELFATAGIGFESLYTSAEFLAA